MAGGALDQYFQLLVALAVLPEPSEQAGHLSSTTLIQCKRYKQLQDLFSKLCLGNFVLLVYDEFHRELVKS